MQASLSETLGLLSANVLALTDMIKSSGIANPEKDQWNKLDQIYRTLSNISTKIQPADSGFKEQFLDAQDELDKINNINLKPFFEKTGAISTLGSGFTFALIVSNLQDPAEVSKTNYFDISTVRIFIATSWLLFTLTLFSSVYLAAVVMIAPTAQTNEPQRSLAKGTVYALLFGAFTCLALTVTAYVDVVGFLLLAVLGLLPMFLLVLRYGLNRRIDQMSGMPVRQVLRQAADHRRQLHLRPRDTHRFGVGQYIRRMIGAS